MGVSKIRIVDGQEIQLFNAGNTSTGSIRMNGTALAVSGASNGVAISNGHNLVFQGATATIGGISSILNIGATGDTIAMDNPSVTYALPKITGSLNVTNTLTVDGNATVGGLLDMTNGPINNVTIIAGQYGTMIKSTDEWLRLNDDASHTSGTYFGSTVVRTDGELQVGSSGANFKATSAGVVTASASIAAPIINGTGPGDSKFSNGTFTDPHVGTAYGAKVSQGVSTDKMNLSGKVNMQWNATENSLDFVFI